MNIPPEVVQTLLVQRRLLLLNDPSWERSIGFEAYVPETVEEFVLGVRPVEPLGPHEAMVFMFSKDSPKEFTMRDVLLRGIEKPSIDIVIDGLPDTRTQNWIRSNSGIVARFLTQAEDQVPVVGAASVIAKTERDACMRLLHEKHPQYGWNKNYGYGTRQHADAIVLHGRSQEHRDVNASVLRKEEI